MKTVKVKKQLFYKQAEFLVSSAVPLQDLVTRALAKLQMVRSRQETISESVFTDGGGTETWIRFINSPRKAMGFQLGSLMVYSPGSNHLALDAALDVAKDELDVSKVAPPDGKHFLESPLYFAIRDNHVVVLQSKSIRTDSLERHLNWLLRQAGIISEKQQLALTDVIPEDVKKRLKAKPISRVLLRTPFFETVAQAETVTGSGVRPAKAARGAGIDILKAILPSAKFSGLNVDQLTELQNVQLSLEVKLSGGRKATKGQAEGDMMKTLARAFRNVPNADFVEVESAGGGTTKGNDLRVHEKVDVDSLDGVLVLSSVYHSLATWLENLIDKGRVVPQH